MNWVRNMTKTEAIELFGGKQAYVARALGISRSSVSEWTEELSQNLTDRVVGAHIRHTRLNNTRTYTGKPVTVK